jgi:hypothetical protein
MFGEVNLLDQKRASYVSFASSSYSLRIPVKAASRTDVMAATVPL